MKPSVEGDRCPVRPRRAAAGFTAGRLLLAAAEDAAFAQLNATQADVQQLTNSLSGSAVLLGDPEVRGRGGGWEGRILVCCRLPAASQLPT